MMIYLNPTIKSIETKLFKNNKKFHEILHKNYAILSMHKLDLKYQQIKIKLFK